MSEGRGRSKKGMIIFILIVVIALFLIWGYVGGQEAKKVGVTCDMGISPTFCWKWHTNAVGQIQEGIDNALGG
ncbi:MAG: hypothetical protein Q7S06_00640 [Nanoarchaeota archaeon]|nr:hypothetical protein [Nanoarchaeota archaeon]